MVLNKKFLFLLVALVAANLIFAHRHEPSGDDEPGHGEEGSSQGRTFFAFSRWVRCNYTAQAGSTCPNYRQALTCYSNNMGRLRTCRGFFRYCNQGRCSRS